MKKEKKSTITDLPNDIRAAVPEAERTPYMEIIINEALQGMYHDFKNNIYAGPKVQLADMLFQAKHPALLPIRQAVMNGEYDESPDAEDKANMKKDWLENGGTEESYKAMFEKE